MRNFFVLAIVGFVLVSCANQIALTGGEKDVLAPELLSSEPMDGSTNVNVKEIRFDFNELVQLKNTSQIVISPLIDKAVKYSAVGKSVFIKLPQGALLDSTTYTIDFKESIADNNESNALKDFTYRFSTYDVMDSISVSGLVINTKTREGVKDVLVGLYKSNKNHIDSLKPSYIAFTNSDGSFSINNVKNGRYFIRAIDDINKDYKLQVNESYGFITNHLIITENMDSLQLALSENRNIKWTSSATQGVFNKPIIVFSKPVFDFDLINSNNKKLHYRMNAQRDTAFLQQKVWADFILLKLDTNKLDTLNIVKLESKEGAKKELQFSLETEKIKGRKVLVKSSLSIDSLNISAFHFMVDSIEFAIDSVVESDRNSVMLFLNKPLGYKTGTITLDSGAVISGDLVSKQSSFPLVFVSETDLGMIEFYLPNGDKHFLLELLDAKGNVLRRKYVNGGSSVVFNKLYEGAYTLRVTIDENNNKIWDSADFEKLIQPEPIFLFGPYQLSKGWELLANTINVN